MPIWNYQSEIEAKIDDGFANIAIPNITTLGATNDEYYGRQHYCERNSVSIRM